MWTSGGYRRGGAQPTVKQTCLQCLESLLVVKHSNLANWPMNWSKTGYGPGPPRPYVHLTSLTWWILPGLPLFHHSSTSVYYSQRKPNRKKQTGNEANAPFATYAHHTHSITCCQVLEPEEAIPVPNSSTACVLIDNLCDMQYMVVGVGIGREGRKYEERIG